MNSNPIGGIFGNKISNQHRYANIVLESLSVLDTTKEIFLDKPIPNLEQSILIKKYSSLLNTLYNSQNDACSLEIIETYNGNPTNDAFTSF